MAHEAEWVQQPTLDRQAPIGQYYCPKCKLEMLVSYNQNRVVESCTGSYWEIVDGSGRGRNASAGSTHAAKYEFDVKALDEIKREGLSAFDSFPCLRSNCYG
jgi:hypothetical protein